MAGTAQTAQPWLEHYPPGVGAAVEVPAHLTLVDILEDSMRRYADRSASRCMERTLSFGQIDHLSQALGAWLQSTGLQQGDRVALMMPNVPQYMVAIAAVLR
ncbi:MAG: AMP-binding protein, partial [Burkholderiaceae bacterium]